MSELHAAVRLQKRTIPLLAHKSPKLHGILMPITVFTTARYINPVPPPNPV